MRKYVNSIIITILINAISEHDVMHIFYFIQCEAWEKVLESVSRQARLQRVLGKRLRNPWSQLKSQIVVFN